MKTIWRMLNKWYAKAMGYFWTPCPICGEEFGGHEYVSGTSLCVSPSSGLCVCKKCKDAAEEINRLNGWCDWRRTENSGMEWRGIYP